jgi:hypothetical protein
VGERISLQVITTQLTVQPAKVAGGGLMGKNGTVSILAIDIMKNEKNVPYKNEMRLLLLYMGI